MTRCPFCLGFIKKGAYICRHCNRELIPEYLSLYRAVLEKYPEYRNNSKESKIELENALRDHYQMNLIVKQTKAAEEQKKYQNLLEQQTRNKEQQEKIRQENLEKIKKYLKNPVFKFFIVPSILVLLVALRIFFSSEEYARWQYLNNGGQIINVDKFILKNFEAINLEKLGDGFKLDSSNSTFLCEIWLNEGQQSSSCNRLINYKNNENTLVSVWYEIEMCKDRKHVKAISGTVFIKRDENLDVNPLSRSPNDDFGSTYGCSLAQNSLLSMKVNP
jgi:hypothetical protein